MAWSQTQLATICVACAKPFRIHHGGPYNSQADADMVNWFCPGGSTQMFMPQGTPVVQPVVKVEAPSHSTPTVQKQSKDVDISDWRAWATTKPGECACGIRKDQCAYHK